MHEWLGMLDAAAGQRPYTHADLGRQVAHRRQPRQRGLREHAIHCLQQLERPAVVTTLYEQVQRSLAGGQLLQQLSS